MAVGCYQIATRRFLAENYTQRDCWSAPAMTRKTTSPTNSHEPEHVERWPDIVALAKQELMDISDDKVIYLSCRWTDVESKKEVESYMGSTFFNVCNLVLEPDSIRVHVPREEAPGTPLSCKSLPLDCLPGVYGACRPRQECLAAPTC